MNKSLENAVKTLKSEPSYSGIFHLLEQYKDTVAGETITKEGALKQYTYSDYADKSYACCGKLQALSQFRKGEIIGLIYETCIEWPALFWGVLMAGGIPLLVNSTINSTSQAEIIKEANAYAYIAEKPLKDCAVPMIDAEQLLSAEGRGIEDWAELAALHTSGTTGNSRVFLFRGSTIANIIASYEEAYYRNPQMPIGEDDISRQLVFLPFHHIFGFTAVYMLYSVLGGTMVYPKDRSIQTILSTCRERHVTGIYSVPMLFQAITGIVKSMMPEEQLKMLCDKGMELQHAGEPLSDDILELRKNLLGNDIKVLCTGGAHVSQETLKILNALGYPFYNGFGMTECGAISLELSTDPMQRAKGSIGKPFSITEYRIGEKNEGVGEFFIRGGSLFDASVIDGKPVDNDKNAWFDTGDLVREEADGLYIEGRSKDIIINASGENIYPDELEEQFHSLAGVKDMCILGMPGKDYDIVTLVLYAPGSDISNLQKEVVNRNNRQPLSFRIGDIIVCEEELPVSGSGKVKRRQLKEDLMLGHNKHSHLSLNDIGNADTEPTTTAMFDENRLAEIRDNIRGILQKSFNVERLEDNRHFITDIGADSLSMIGAMCAIENEYSLVFTDDERMRLFTLESVARQVYAKLNNVTLSDAAIKGIKETETERITDFSKSAEYLAFRKRINDTFGDDIPNPYFLPHDSMIFDTSVINGREVINLGSYNYLGMSGHPETKQAAIEAVEKYGTSSSGSRPLAGEKTIYQRLERTIAEWKHTEDAITCTGGWATNLAFVSCFMKEGDFILYDTFCHNSIAEGIALSKAESKAFLHNDLEMAENILKHIEGKYRKVLICTEGVYSMDGDIAPIPQIVELKKKYKCFLLVDEAHSSGIIGEHGGGVDDYFGLAPDDIDFKYGTMSKELGACGGYVAGKHDVIEYLRYNMNGFVFTAGITPPAVAAIEKAIEIIQRDNTIVQKLHRNMKYFARRCVEEGMDIGVAGESAIVPIRIGSDADAARLSAKMLERGIFVPPAMYPAVPMGQSRLRFTISATHSLEQLETAVTELKKLMIEEGFLK